MTDQVNAPNIFILLELDPDQAWNQAEFDQKLQNKRQEWSRLVNLPTQKGIQAKQNLNFIPELQKIAGDLSQRQAQAAAARKLKEKEQAAKLAEFEVRLEYIQTKGHILEEELNHLAQEFAGLVSEPEIRQRLTVPVEKAQPAARSRRAALEPSKAKDIQRKLQGLDKTDLYNFLGMANQTESRLLLQAAKRLYDTIQRKAAKTPHDTLISELSGYGLDIFKSDIERARYDETLRLQQYEELTKKVEVIGQISKEIDEKQMEKLLQEARAKGLDVNEAQSVIKEYASQKKYAVVISSQTRQFLDQLQRCGYCRALNDKDKTYCTTCGQPLREACPTCERPVSSADMVCGQCGFPTGNRSWLKVLLNDANQAVADRDYETAMSYLSQAAQAWPADVGSNHPLAKDIRDLETRIAPLKENQLSLLSQVEAAIRQRRFYSARDLLPHLAQLLPAGSPRIAEFRRQVEARIGEAETKLAQARRTEGSDPEKAVSLYQAVLQTCQDCRQAREMLAKTPPSPPEMLQAITGDKVTHLSWQPSPSAGVRYTVVRKKHSRPVSAADGEALSTISGTVYDDPATEVGVPVFYAVFADREGVRSTTAAMLVQPVLKLQDAAKLTARVGDRQVHLQWQPPANVHEVVVVRSDTAYPASIQTGRHIPALDKYQAVDKEVNNEQRYFYTVFCRFKDHSGRLQTTSGVGIEATPQHPPAPIKELRMAASGPLHTRQLELRWSPPSKGDVVVIKSAQTTGLQTGEVIPQEELAKYGQLLTTTSNQLSEKINHLGIYYFLPVIVFQRMAYIGQEHQYVCVDDVSELSVQNLGHALRLQWQWPQNCFEVLVGVSNQGWPKPHQPDTITYPLTRAQYDLHGYYDLSNPVKADYYITVFAVISHKEQKIIASGEAKTARKLVSLASRITVTYEIRKAWLGKKLSLKLSIKGQGSLPALILTRKQTTLPLNKYDGEIIFQLEAAPVRKEQLIVSLPEAAKRKQSYAKLFLESDDLYDVVTIHHPAREKLRLF